MSREYRNAGKVSWDTAANYEILEDAIDRDGISATELLNTFSNWFGLQLFDEKNTAGLLEELGYEEVE